MKSRSPALPLDMAFPNMELLNSVLVNSTTKVTVPPANTNNNNNKPMAPLV
jgi:hypothetical protein